MLAVHGKKLCFLAKAAAGRIASCRDGLSIECNDAADGLAQRLATLRGDLLAQLKKTFVCNMIRFELKFLA